MAPSVVPLATLLVTLLLCCATLAAAQSTTTDIETTCRRMNSANDYCDVQTTCQRCVRSDGCAFDMAMYSCVVAPTNGRPLYERSSNPLLNRTNYTYCADGDILCSACDATLAKPLCEGQNGCMCRSLCNVLRTAQQNCYNQRQGYLTYVSIAAIALVLPMLVMAQRRCARGRALDRDDIRAELRRRLILQQRQREREYQRPPSAMALQLESWRSHRDTHMVDVGTLELKTCYALMENDSREVNAEGRGDCEAEDIAREAEAVDVEIVSREEPAPEPHASGNRGPDAENSSTDRNTTHM